MITGTEAAKNWSKGMSGAAEKMKQGVNNVTSSPTEAAANAVPRQVQGVVDAANSGKTAAALRRVTLADWKNAMLTKGVPRIASGAAQAESKMATFLNEFLPWVQQGVEALKSTPRGDLETNISRANQMMRHNAQFRRSR